MIRENAMATVLEILRDHGDIPANLADLQEHLGGIPIERISMMPPPGTATEEDLWRWKYCELVDGVIVVKASNLIKGLLSTKLMFALGMWAQESNLHGYVFPSAAYRFADVIRLPDISYVSAKTWGDRRLEDVEVGDFTPDVVVDFVVRENTAREMQRKRAEYADAGVKLIWTVDTLEHVVWVTRPEETASESRCLKRCDTLESREVLPGFSLPIEDWFSEVERVFRR